MSSHPLPLNLVLTVLVGVGPALPQDRDPALAAHRQSVLEDGGLVEQPRPGPALGPRPRPAPGAGVTSLHGVQHTVPALALVLSYRETQCCKDLSTNFREV